LAPSNWNWTLATLTLSLAFAETLTVPATFAPFAGAVRVTVGGVVSLVVLFTVTVTLALVVLFPAPSVAMARNVWLPLDDFVESQENAYGEAAFAEPRFAPSNWNCTPATLTLSAAVAVTATVPETVAPLAGEVIVTVGGVVSFVVLSTFTVMLALVAEFPAASVATALIVWLPLDSVVEFNTYAKGAADKLAPTFPPSTRNCTLATPTLSEAAAVTFTLPESVEPAAGDVIVTLGGMVSAPLGVENI
jgi:hypothetical protein